MQTKQEILFAVITAYREVIRERYRYEALLHRPDFPADFAEERVEAFREYFLTYLYPAPERRAELDAAFANLDTYIAEPKKLLRLLTDSAGLLFKYGRHLPKILQAGMKALQSFRAANRFEMQLVENAQALNLQTPYTRRDVALLIRQLPQSEINKFIVSGKNLFETLHDRKLVKKIEEIIGTLLDKMRKRPDTYGPEEVRALEIGYELIHVGNGLFDELTPAEQRQLLNLATDLEQEYIDSVFAEQE